MTKPHYRRHADGSTSIMLNDSFANMLTGLGRGDIKSSANTYVLPISSRELEAAYRTSTWFGKIVDIPAFDATREWRSWKGDNEQIEAIETSERKLGIQQKVWQALTWQRLYGGSAIIFGGLPGDETQELDFDRITKGSIKFATVLSKDELNAVGMIRNPMSPDYGKPEYFEYANVGSRSRIHPSRVFSFNGRKVAPLSSQQEFWGDPIWNHLEAAVKSADASGAVIDALLQESKIDVLRVNGMTKGLATAEYESLMIRRFQMVAILKGMQNVMLLDKDDEWEQKQIDWKGLPEIGQHVLNILSGSADIPMFRLTGQNLTGLSGKGDAETRAYFDGVRSDQKLKLSPSLNPIDEVLIRDALGSRPDGLWYEWISLYQMTEKERAEVDKLEAETASMYAISGLIPSGALSKAVQNRMVESGRWSALEQALEEEPDEEEEDAKLAKEVEALLRAAQERQTVTQLQAPQAGQDIGDSAARGPLSGAFTDATPRTLYVRRDVLNWEAIAAHYKAQGFKVTVGSEMHVTVVYSKAEVDWMAMGSSWQANLTVPAGGPRINENFGEGGEAKVLMFYSDELNWRHQAAKEAGASYSHDEYQPHITISWDPSAPSEGVEPWQGEIELGPEIFQELNPDWKSGLTEDVKHD